MRKIAAESLGIKEDMADYVAGTGRWSLFQGELKRKMLGFYSGKVQSFGGAGQGRRCPPSQRKGGICNFSQRETDGDISSVSG